MRLPIGLSLLVYFYHTIFELFDVEECRDLEGSLRGR